MSEPQMTKKRSLIQNYFSMELKDEIFKVTLEHILDNNEKGKIIKDLLTKYNVPYTSLGSGTNRMAVLIDGYAVKIGLDKDGMIDNRREFLYTRELQPYVVKVYECTQNGLLAVTEYVSIFTLDDFHNYQEDMREILSEISNFFLIGDVGITGKNYVNWGLRNDGTICILDFAYIYSVKYKLFVCTCDDESILNYDKDYNVLICPHCGKKYRFAEIRKRITAKNQEDEIGDIRRLGYNITKPEELVPVNPDFENIKPEKKKKKKVDPADEARKALKAEKKKRKEQRLKFGIDDFDEN